MYARESLKTGVKIGEVPMLNQELELSLNMAFARAREHRHEFMTVEHLLLALLSNPRPARRLKRVPWTWWRCVRNLKPSSNRPHPFCPPRKKSVTPSRR
ncbi:hypothetical protein DMB90_14085 [Raoultella planticola]|uniref:Clp R domain-containing protein n=1 Tax=Raoultella planticola TaxID=575 RepID=A0A5P6AA28_RAOPL|nr:hypothetical protein DMB90_14085 [Raoultella planticola]